MNQFLITLLKFILPIIAALVGIILIPVNKEYAYSFVIKGGCEGRSHWLYERIYKDTTPVDVAFIGTSHAMSAMNDSLIERQVDSANRATWHFSNLAYCGFGRNFDYLVVKDLLRHKRVKLILLEVRENEGSLGHGSFVHVADTWDVLNAPIAFNRSYLPDIYHLLLYHLQYIREMVTGENLARHIENPNTLYGFNGNIRVADSSEMKKMKRKRQHVQKPIPIIDAGLNAYPLKYVARIKALADANNTRLALIYIPAYGYDLKYDSISNVYSQYGPVIFPPAELLENPENWMDEGHLNLKAANELSGDLVKKIEALMDRHVTR